MPPTKSTPRFSIGRESDRSFRITRALEERDKGTYATDKEAAAAFGVHPDSIGRRRKGTQTIREARVLRQLLSVPQEKVLRNWIIQYSKAGCPMSRKLVTSVVSSLLADGCDEPSRTIHSSWIDCFIKRHNDVCSMAGGLVGSRLWVNDDELSMWHNCLYESIVIGEAKPKNIYNMDEIGFNEGGTNTKGRNVINLVGMDATTAEPSRKGNVTVLECVSADGFCLDPTVVYKGSGKEAADLWTPKDKYFEKWTFEASQTGLITDSIACTWLYNFIEVAKERAQGEKIVLILDGHGSHVSHFFILYCFRAGINLLVMPRHSSHLLQPLDAGLFSPLKQDNGDLLSVHHGLVELKMQEVDWAKLYFVSRAVAMTRENIEASFANTGVYPVSHDRMLHNKRKYMDEQAGVCTSVPASVPVADVPVPS